MLRRHNLSPFQSKKKSKIAPSLPLTTTTNINDDSLFQSLDDLVSLWEQRLSKSTSSTTLSPCWLGTDPPYLFLHFFKCQYLSFQIVSRQSRVHHHVLHPRIVRITSSQHYCCVQLIELWFIKGRLCKNSKMASVPICQIW